MANFFRVFPSINYDPQTLAPQTTKDITKRINYINTLKKYKLIYYTYNVKDGERADVIAEKYYGSSSLDWLIYLINDIHDPFFDWPLPTNVLYEMIKMKYGSFENATQTIHHYEIIINEKEELSNRDFSDATYLIVDFDTYTQYPAERRRVVTNFDYEVEKNDRKRNIKLLDAQFINQILDEYEKIFKPVNDQ